MEIFPKNSHYLSLLPKLSEYVRFGFASLPIHRSLYDDKNGKEM